MNNNKPTSTEILNRIDRFTSSDDLTVEELRESLIIEGIDPDKALDNIKRNISHLITFKEPPIKSGDVQSQLISFPGIFAAAGSLGFTNSKLAELTGLSQTLLIKLDRKLVSLKGFSKIAKVVAEVLKTTKEIVQDYIDGQALYPAEANFKADASPELPQKQSFADAIKTDPLLSQEAKDELLSMSDDD